MARQFDASVERALRGASARARMCDGWFEISAPVPESVLAAYDDAWALRVNARLHTRARLARPCGEAPLLKADVFLEHHDNPFALVPGACLDVTRAVSAIARSIEKWEPMPAAPDPEKGSEEIARACSEAGWRVASQEGADVRVEVPGRGRVYPAWLETLSTGASRFVVELVGRGDRSAESIRAVSALLMAVSASVRMVSGLLLEGESPRFAIAAPLETPLDGSVDRALSALSVACSLAGREASALCDPDLASEYLALYRGRVHCTRPLFKEEEPCLQQQP
jgi:hypothetical protein